MNSETTPNMESTATDQKSGRPGSKLVSFLYVILVIALIATAIFYYQAKSIEKNPNQVAEEKVVTLISQVDKLIDLPQGETPTIAVVNDPKALIGNTFFANAQIGDQVLFYPVAGKAYLYNPTKNMIIEVQSLNIGR